GSGGRAGWAPAGGPPASASCAAPGPQPLGELLQRAVERVVRRGRGRGAGDHHHVQARRPPVASLPEGLAHVTTDPDAGHRVADLAGDGDAQPGRSTARTGQDQRQEDAVRKLPPATLDAYEVPAAPEARCLGESDARGRGGCRRRPGRHVCHLPVSYFLNADTT